VSQKRTPIRTKLDRSSGMKMIKTLVGSSDDGSDKDPPKKNI
jgi:hypothetical protein